MSANQREPCPEALKRPAEYSDWPATLTGLCVALQFATLRNTPTIRRTP